MPLNISSAAINHIACLLSVEDRFVVERLDRHARAAVRNKGFLGTKLKDRIVNRGADRIESIPMDDLAVIRLFGALFREHTGLEVQKIIEDIGALQARQARVLSRLKFEAILDEAYVQMGMKYLGGSQDVIDAWKQGVRARRAAPRRKYGEYPEPEMDMIAAWKKRAKALRPITQWREDTEALQREVSKLRALQELRDGKDPKLDAFRKRHFRRATDRFQIVEEVEQMGRDFPICGFPNIPLGSDIELYSLSERIQALWPTLTHALPLPASLYRRNKFSEVLRDISHKTLSLRVRAMLAPYAGELAGTIDAFSITQIAYMVRGGDFSSVGFVCEPFARNRDLQVPTTMSALLNALVVRKQFEHAKLLVQCLPLRPYGATEDMSSLLFVALKERWSLDQIRKFVPQETLHKLGMLRIAMTAGRGDVVELLIGNNRNRVAALLAFFKDHPRLELLVNVYRTMDLPLTTYEGGVFQFLRTHCSRQPRKTPREAHRGFMLDEAWRALIYGSEAAGMEQSVVASKMTLQELSDYVYRVIYGEPQIRPHHQG